MRVSAGGRSVTYSGDTGPTPALAELARGTDIALFEASCVGTDNPPDLHMTGADAARAAREAGAGLLLLTHLVAWNDGGRRRGGGDRRVPRRRSRSRRAGDDHHAVTPRRAVRPAG